MKNGEIVRALRATESRSKRELLDAAADLIEKLTDRLAAYEDTGLMPEEAKRMSNILMDVGIDYNCSWEYVKNWLLDARLRELSEADRDGRLVVLPCNGWLEIVFGDQVLFWGIDRECMEQPVREISVDDADRIGWCDGYKTVYLKGTDENGEVWEFSPDEIGKTVFLTREEAEKALEAMKK